MIPSETCHEKPGLMHQVPCITSFAAVLKDERFPLVCKAVPQISVSLYSRLYGRYNADSTKQVLIIHNFYVDFSFVFFCTESRYENLTRWSFRNFYQSRITIKPIDS